MRLIIFFFIIFTIQSCSKPRTVLICGDHICINKSEAEKYFEENLSIEVKIIDDKKKNNINLVQLNLQRNNANKKMVSIKKKDKTSQQIKTLTKSEIKTIKSKLKKKKEDKKIAKKTNANNQPGKKLSTTYKTSNNKPIGKIEKNKEKNNSAKILDVCTIVKKCSIDEISKFLIKEGNKKKFPNISIRE